MGPRRRLGIHALRLTEQHGTRSAGPKNTFRSEILAPQRRLGNDANLWVSNWDQAQQLMDSQLQADWPKILDQIAGALNPIHDKIFERERVGYRYRIPGPRRPTTA